MKITLKDYPAYVEDEGEEVETLYRIEVEISPAEPQTRDYPGCDAEAEILSIALSGKMTFRAIPESEWAARGLDVEKIKEAAFEAVPSRDDDDPPDSWEPRDVSPQDDPHDD